MMQMPALKNNDIGLASTAQRMTNSDCKTLWHEISTLADTK